MQRQVGSVFSRSGTRFFSAMVIISILFSVLPAFSPLAAKAQDGGVATYIAEVRECPPGFDPSSGDASAALANCVSPLAGVAITLSDTRTTGGDGVIAWGDIPLGEGYSVTLSIPSGYGAPWVYCEVSGGPGGNQYLYFQTPGGAMDIGRSNPALSQSAQTHCWWFNIPPADPALVLAQEDTEFPAVTVDVYSFLCPAETSVEGTSHDSFSQTCASPAEGVQFTLTPSQGDPYINPTGADGHLIWHNVPPGPLSVSETVPQGYQLGPVYCHPTPPPDFVDALIWELFPLQNGVVTYDLPDQYALSCEFYNLLAESGPGTQTEGTPAAVLDAIYYSTITVAVHHCEVVPVLQPAPPVGELLTACPNPLAGVSFSVTRSEETVEEGTTDDDGIATLESQSGELNLIENRAGEKQGVYAHCEIRDAGVAPVYVNGGLLNPGDPNMPLGDETKSHAFYCDWFTAPFEGGKVEGGGNIVVTKWRCPELYDATTATFEELLEDCATPHDGVQIAVSYPSGESLTEQTASGKGGPAIARFEGLPPGNVGIGEPDPNGHALERAFCSTGEISQPALTATEGSVEQNVGDNGIPITIEAGKEITCHLFNVPVVEEDSPPGAGSVFVDKRICPPGFTAIGKNYVDIAMYCTSEGGIEFKVTQGETVQSAVTGEDGVAEFSGISAGALRITELPREGYDPPRVFCRETEEGAGETGELLAVTVDSWGVAYDLREGYYLQCVWANMPAATASTDPGTVILHVYTCPEGTGEYEAFEKLVVSCTERRDELKFTAGKFLATPAEGVTGQGGDVQLTGLEPGFNSVEEVSAQGYRPIAAWCDYYVSTTGSAGDFAGVPAQPLQAYISGGYTLECNWFNVPYIEPLELSIQSRVCPSTFDLVDATTDKILNECPASPAGVPFRVQKASGFASDASAGYDVTQRTDDAGLIALDNVASSTIAITEGAQRYQTVRVICGHAPPGQSPSSYLVVGITNDEVSYKAEPGAVVTCYWASFEHELVALDVHKRLCPPGIDVAASTFDVLKEECAAVKGVEFLLASVDESYKTDKLTDAVGVATFADALPGGLTLSEDSDDHLAVRVFCGTPQTGFAEASVDSESIKLTANPGDKLACYWFNIENPYATVFLHKFGCPEEYVPDGDDLETVQAKCPQALADVAFTLGGPATEIRQSTDTAGEIRWDDVSPGSIFISETPPDGYRSAAVFCRIASDRTGDSDYEPVIVEQFAIQQDVQARDKLDCYWFNLTQHDAPDQPSVTPTATPASTPSTPPVTGTPGNQPANAGGGQSVDSSPDPSGPATLIIARYICEPGYNVYEEAAEPARDCVEPEEDVAFTLVAQGEDDGLTRSTGDDGTGRVAFTGLVPGLYVLLQEPSDDTSTAFISTCTSDRREFEAENPFVPFAYVGPEHQAGIVLQAGETLECDWNSVPAVRTGIALTHYLCNGEPVIVSTCDVSGASVSMILRAVGDEEPLQEIPVETDDDGTALVEAEGEFELVGSLVEFCFVESEAMSEEGHIVVDPGVLADVKLYTCSSQELANNS